MPAYRRPTLPRRRQGRGARSGVRSHARLRGQCRSRLRDVKTNRRYGCAAPRLLGVGENLSRWCRRKPPHGPLAADGGPVAGPAPGATSWCPPATSLGRGPPSPIAADLWKPQGRLPIRLARAVPASATGSHRKSGLCACRGRPDGVEPPRSPGRHDVYRPDHDGMRGRVPAASCGPGLSGGKAVAQGARACRNLRALTPPGYQASCRVRR